MNITYFIATYCAGSFITGVYIAATTNIKEASGNNAGEIFGLVLWSTVFPLYWALGLSMLIIKTFVGSVIFTSNAVTKLIKHVK